MAEMIAKAMTPLRWSKQQQHFVSIVMLARDYGSLE
jgi:hypothetical protein